MYIHDFSWIEIIITSDASDGKRLLAVTSDVTSGLLDEVVRKFEMGVWSRGRHAALTSIRNSLAVLKVSLFGNEQFDGVCLPQSTGYDADSSLKNSTYKIYV